MMYVQLIGNDKSVGRLQILVVHYSPLDCNKGRCKFWLHFTVHLIATKNVANIGCGGKICTCDLWVMSPTSYQTAPPRDIKNNVFYTYFLQLCFSFGKNVFYPIIIVYSLAVSYSCRGQASTTIGAGARNYFVREGKRCHTPS